jgi:hypothetical protein
MHCHGGHFYGDSCFIPGIVYLRVCVGFLSSYACFLCFSTNGAFPVSEQLLASPFFSSEKSCLRMEQKVQQRENCCAVIPVSTARKFPGDLTTPSNGAGACGPVWGEAPRNDSPRNRLKSAWPVRALPPFIVNLVAWLLVISLWFL